ncbi:ester cyclase [Streptomyces sp. NPDC058439]|uniref:ester cyclase n=1 Tax=Streptomyces sp. NPDC058439 TaxID=3346500 RepID=UPI003650C15F
MLTKRSSAVACRRSAPPTRTVGRRATRPTPSRRTFPSVRFGRGTRSSQWRGWVTAIPDTRMEIRSLFADDRHGTCEWTTAGTLKGAMDGLPAPIVEAARGKSFTIQGVTVYEFCAYGRISREALYWDLALVLGQFGLLPPL